MKPLPADPYAFQARMMAAFEADIRDRKAVGFPRMEALRATTIAIREGAK